MKSNVVLAALAGLGLGMIAELFFGVVDNIPVLGCLVTPVAALLGLGLPLLIGALAVILAPTREISFALDGALAAAFAELISRLVGFCASIYFARSFFFGPRFLLPSVEPATRALFNSIWAIGWFAVSIALAAILGAVGAALYVFKSRR